MKLERTGRAPPARTTRRGAKKRRGCERLADAAGSVLPDRACSRRATSDRAVPATGGGLRVR